MGKQSREEAEMNGVCNICQGRVEQALTTYTQWYEGRLIVIENVPAWVCQQCGETYYDPDVVDRIQDVIWSGGCPRADGGGLGLRSERSLAVAGRGRSNDA